MFPRDTMTAAVTRCSLVAIVTAVLGAGGCLRDRPVAELDDGNIEAAWWVRRELGGGGRGVGIREWEELELTRPQKLVVPLDLSFRSRAEGKGTAELAGSPSGMELAYREMAGDPWRFVYLSKAAPRLFSHCRLRLGEGEAPDWGRMVPFLQAAPELLQCSGRVSQALCEEVRARGGDRALADVLVLGRETRLPEPARVRPPAGTPYDDWEGAMDRLPAAERARVVDALRRDLASAGSSGEALTRASWRVDPIDGAVLAARARELMGRPERGPLPVLLARLAEARPPEAGALACAALPSAFGEGWVPDADATALAVIAATKAPCPAVAALLGARADEYGYDCREAGGPHLCTEQELAPLVQARVRGVATDRWFSANEHGLGGFQALLAAGYAQGALPAPVVEQGERRRALSEGCIAFRAWLQRSRNEQQATLSSEQWNATRTNAEKAAARRKSAQADRALGARAPELQHPKLREIEVRRNSCSTRVARLWDEEAAAWEAGDPAGIAAAVERASQLQGECMAIESEAHILCRGTGR